MKHNIKYVISLVFVLLFTQGAWADPAVTIIKQLNGSAVSTTSPGDVGHNVSSGTCTLTVTPAYGNYVTKDFITVYSVVTGDVAQAPRRSPNLDNSPIEVTPKDANADPAGETQYTFPMPDDGSDVEVTVDFQSMVMYDLFIGETQVTELNASDVLKNGKVSFTPASDANVNTLTLNGATLTVPVKVGLANLTLDIQGTNSITTSEICIQKISNTNPTVTYKSTSNEVGSLTLTSTGSEGVNNSSSFSFSKELAVLLTVYGYDDYTSNTYYFTDGSTSVAKIVPSYGVKVGDMQVYAGNATDVLKDGTVSFDKSTNKLTLNGANTGTISTSLSSLIIELVGDNTLSSGSSSTLQSSTGDAVAMTIQSTGATKGSLRMNMNYSSTDTYVGTNVTLNIAEPLAVVEGKLNVISGNDNTVIIGEPYGLTVAGVIVSKFNASAITGEQIQLNDGGSVSYDVQNKTLTLNNAVFNVTSSAPIIKSNLDNLKVNVAGSVWFNFVDADPSYVFQSTNTNAVLTFTTTDENPVLSIPRGIDAGAFTGFKKVEYKNGLALSTKDGEVPSYTIDLMEAPIVGDFSIDESTGRYTGYITTNNYDNATIKYAITYADGVHQNVSETNYDESVSLESPGTLTAYIVVGESQSPVTTAKYYGFTQHEIADTLGKTSVAVPAIIPAIQETDGLTVSYLSDGNIASVADGVIVKGGKVGTTDISAILNVVTAEPSFIVLNDNYEGGYRVEGLSVTVVPAAPSISLESGTYNGTQYVTLTSNLPEGVSGFIHYKRIVNGEEMVDSTYSVPLTIDETTTLTYYQEAFDDEGVAFNSKTQSVTYVIRQEPGYHFSDSESGQTYYSSGSTVYNLSFGEENTLPWLIDVPEGLAITYNSEDENVATIDQNGNITLTGAGHVWLTASNVATDLYQAHTERIRLEIRPTDPQASLAEGVYFTGQKLTLIPTVPNGTIYYSFGWSGDKVKYEGEEIELPNGAYEFYTYTRCATDADSSPTDYMQSYGNNHRYYYVYDQPAFSVASGTYDETLEITISPLPESENASIYYYYGDDDENPLEYEESIAVTESTKVTAYIRVEGDSGKVHKSEIIQAQYVIRQDAGLTYLQNGEYVEVAEYTIGGDENSPLPTLQNENNLEVTYSSSNTSVATVNASTGEVTIIGLGETTVTATSEQTDVLLAGNASYLLRVYKDLNHDNITVTVADGTYTGSAVTPEVSVLDGSTDVSDFFNFTYSDNVQVGTNAKVTITPKELTDAVNYYVGERMEIFAINNRTLEVGEGKDVNFVEGQKWASLYKTNESLNLPEGYMAYIVTATNSTSATVTPINYVPKNVPVLIEKDSELTSVENTSAEGNMLRGADTDIAVSAINGTVYGLYNNKLMRVTSGTIRAGRCYLLTNETQARDLSIVFDGELTGISHVTQDNHPALDDNNWYTLDGRKLQKKPVKKGIYIKNGHKVVINNK